MAFCVRIVATLQEHLMCGEVIVGGASLENIDECKAAMCNGCLENACHHCDIAGPRAGDEGRLEREDEIHGVERVLGDAVRGTVHRLALLRETACLPRGKAVVAIIVQDKGDRVVTADTVDEVPHAFGEACAVAAEGHHRKPGVGELGTGRKWDDAAMKTVETVSQQLVTGIPMASDVIAEQNAVRRDVALAECPLHRRPDAVVAAAVAPRALVCAVESAHFLGRT